MTNTIAVLAFLTLAPGARAETCRTDACFTAGVDAGISQVKEANVKPSLESFKAALSRKAQGLGRAYLETIAGMREDTRSMASRLRKVRRSDAYASCAQLQLHPQKVYYEGCAEVRRLWGAAAEAKTGDAETTRVKVAAALKDLEGFSAALEHPGRKALSEWASGQLRADFGYGASRMDRSRIGGFHDLQLKCERDIAPGEPTLCKLDSLIDFLETGMEGLFAVEERSFAEDLAATLKRIAEFTEPAL